jgi:hypothetical protein
MNVRAALIAGLILLSAIPANAGGEKKKGERAMVEKMESVPCGAREKGVTGLGTVWASAGITHVDNDEKLCPQYFLNLKNNFVADWQHGGVSCPLGGCGIPSDRLSPCTYLVVAMKPNSEVSASAKSNNP